MSNQEADQGKPEETPAKEGQVVLPSIDDAKPVEEGGPTARKGFNYQDEIAVSFLIRMLEDPAILKIHCETHDDIVVVHAPEGAAPRIAEYVQVKASEQDQLWSVANLCQKKSKATGTSIFEVSLARDRHQESSRFRLVTLRPVRSELKLLTFPLTASGRESSCEEFKALLAELNTRFPELKSPKGNGASYWLSNCCWDQRHGEDEVRTQNLVSIIKLSAAEGRMLLLEQAELILDELRARAKAAGDAKWDSDREKKIIARAVLRAWWEARTAELIDGASAASGGKLKTKMEEAVLPDDVIGLAVDLRRSYSEMCRAPRYLESDQTATLQNRVKSEVISLRSQLIAGELDVNGAEFHSLCLGQMDKIDSALPPAMEDRSAFLKGCLYDIADRCMLRFVRSQ